MGGFSGPVWIEGGLSDLRQIILFIYLPQPRIKTHLISTGSQAIGKNLQLL
jgi:hypothetical protein